MLYLLDGTDPESPFPDPATAETEPDGLLAVGGDLSPARLLNAYRQGVFPWYSDGQPILWWSPNPRMVLFPDELHISRSLARERRRGRFRTSFDQAFDQVIRACAEPRRHEQGTWLTSEMIAAYSILHQQGHAHSVEAWLDDRLVGGVYGIMQGRLFFGESMFSRVANASKVAFVELVQALARTGCRVIDCQVYTAHLESLGARMIPRDTFIRLLEEGLEAEMNFPPQV